MNNFGVLVIAIDEYPDPPGPLPASASADVLARLVVGERGGVLVERIVAASGEDVLGAFRRWAAAKSDRPRSTIVYLAGHGTDDGLEHSFLVPDGPSTVEIETKTLGTHFEKDWFLRQGDRESWTLFILDCCGADIGVVNLEAELSQHAYKRPRRLAMWPTTPRGAAHSGRFVAALEEALATFTENDATVPLNELFLRALPALGDVEPLGFLPPGASLKNDRHSATPVVMNVDAHRELRRVIAGLPAEVRSHFLNKAQGAEAGELTWHFEGREAELALLSAWLRDAPSGLRVVTGEAGSGKSALLGHLSVLADDELVEAYVATGLAPKLRDAPRPPSGVFDATVHLTGKLLADVLDSIMMQLGARADAAHSEQAPEAQRWSGTTSELIRYLRERRPERERPFTVLADALDEAQEPLRIAETLSALARSDVCRVLVGTRRSLDEGPDRPADPARRELLEALGARDGEVVVVSNDRRATYEYVLSRLSGEGSPYADRDEARRSLATLIADAEQPFLFARLATSELRALPAVEPGSPVLDMLDKGHAGIFGAAVERIAAREPAAGAMLRALALGRGRGLPESGHTWVTVARAISRDVEIPDSAVRIALELAAPYITLDAEGGQSTYRLAHQTFVEHYEARLEVSSKLDTAERSIARKLRDLAEYIGMPETAANHYVARCLAERSIAKALGDLVERSGGWEVANYYLVRYLPGHFGAAEDYDGLAGLVTDPGWLTRAIDLLGIDLTVDAISIGPGPLPPVPLPERFRNSKTEANWTTVETVRRALRRSRVALSRDPDQLSGQMTARLRNSSDVRLEKLGNAIAASRPHATLQMSYGLLDWRADLETTYGLVGTVRALAFGRLDDDLLLAIGIDDRIHLWNPLRGAGDARVIGNDGRRINALAFGALDGRMVLVVASYYDDQVIVLRDPRSGDRIGEPFELSGYVDSVSMGMLGERLAIVAAGGGNIEAWDARTRMRIGELPDLPFPASVLCVSGFFGRLVAHVTRPRQPSTDEGLYEAWTVDVATGEAIGPVLLDGEPRIAAGDAGAVCAWSPGPVHSPKVVTWSPGFGKVIDELETEANVDMRSIAFARLEGSSRRVVAVSPDYHGTGLVTLTELDYASRDGEAETDLGPKWCGRSIEAVIKLEDGTFVLTNEPVELHALEKTGGAPPRKADRACVTFALTGRRDDKANFVRGSLGATSRLVRAPEPSRGANPLGGEVEPFSLDEPTEWPQTAVAWGLVGGIPVVATGSIDGAVWIWGASGNPLFGPLTTVSSHVLEMGWSALAVKGGPPVVDSLALGCHSVHGDVVAIVTDGRVRLVSLPDGTELPTPDERATVVTSVALGTIRDEDILVTGSKGGVLVVWNLTAGTRIAALTLDHRIDRVWVVRGAEAVAARAGDRLFVLEVKAGADERWGR